MIARTTQRRVGLQSPAMALFVIAFLINWPWEMIQMGLYEGWGQIPWTESLLGCSLAAAGDAGLTVLLRGLGRLVVQPRKPIRASRGRFYLALGLLGVTSAAVIEWAALKLGLWSYAPSMPIVPGTGIALVPLAQLAALVPLATWLGMRWKARK